MGFIEEEKPVLLEKIEKVEGYDKLTAMSKDILTLLTGAWDTLTQDQKTEAVERLNKDITNMLSPSWIERFVAPQFIDQHFEEMRTMQAVSNMLEIEVGV